MDQGSVEADWGQPGPSLGRRSGDEAPFEFDIGHSGMAEANTEGRNSSTMADVLERILQLESDRDLGSIVNRIRCVASTKTVAENEARPTRVSAQFPKQIEPYATMDHEPHGTPPRLSGTG
ncbi:uncharacterized protein CCOS01_13335 [Colletotrichum costaricense]|uniref:Uncharacterized protein n=1 Tax=Colletotrichum costaricense TaxID=1209916 RepID=A0AAI9YL82_9PEZI|nr:uncharacterized protein CCOS01_13335 [Colletotrichum costaricense]KAK1515142.1 hypothetical protein CCOS01_13335 [Colletotrichum costaricense]